MVELEWDEGKRLSNLEKHKLDFLICRRIFDGRSIVTEDVIRGGEIRHVTTCIHDEDFVTVVWTKRSKAIRIISLRRARNGEKARYQTLHGS